MKLSSTIRVESKAMPGVAFVIRKINKRRRDDIEEIIRPIVEGMPDRAEYVALSTERGEDPLPDAEKEARWWQLVLRASRLYTRDAQPAILRCCLVRIEGLEIEDAAGASHPATLDDLADCCEEADALYAEIAAAVERERGLTPDEAKNSGSLSTSAAPEGGNRDSAAPAETPVTTIASAA